MLPCEQWVLIRQYDEIESFSGPVKYFNFCALMWVSYSLLTLPDLLFHDIVQMTCDSKGGKGFQMVDPYFLTHMRKLFIHVVSVYMFIAYGN